MHSEVKQESMLTRCSHQPHLRPRIFTPYPGLFLIKRKNVISRIYEAAGEKLQQEMLLAASPGGLIMPAREICSSITGCLGVLIHLQRFSGGGKPSSALHSYTCRQRKSSTRIETSRLAAAEQDSTFSQPPNRNGVSEQLSATSVQQPGISICSHESHSSRCSGPSTRRT